MIGIFISIGLTALFFVLVALDYEYSSEQQRWDRAAGSLQVDGYTDQDIVDILGPRPSDEEK